MSTRHPTVPCADTGNPVNLLACPFCGSPAALEINETPDFGMIVSGKPTPPNERLSFHVRCSSPPAMRCSMGKHWLDSSAERAAAAWNRRDNEAKLRKVIAYMERQVREVWLPPPNDTYQAVHRAWCMEEADKALK